MKQSLPLIFLGAAFVNNVVLVRFLGICPFMGVSKQIKTSLGMGAAVTFVMTLASMVTWFIQTYFLKPYELGFLQTIIFILIIATFVQLVEMIIQKQSPALYDSLGVFLPLITTNCAVLGVAILNIQKNYGLIESIVHSLGTALGFTIALVIMAGIRERLEFAPIPEPLKGTPIAFIIAGLMSIAFMGFSGMM